MNKSLYRIIAALSLIFMCLSFHVPARAEERAEGKNIRVGYLISTGYQEGLEGEYKTGLGYEYYQKISYYTGWSYTYVYGGFSELLGKLSNGEIDVMGNISYTDERAVTMDFSTREQGYESYYLYTRASDKEISEDNWQPLNGKRVGISEGSIQNELFLMWCARNGVNCEVVTYKDKTERENALDSGEIDATVTPQVVSNDPAYANWRAAFKISESPYYFAVSKKSDPEILPELNNALDLIFSANPRFYDDLHDKYYSGLLMQPNVWTDDEAKWLESRKNRVKVGYLDNYLPLSDKTGKGVGGMLADIASSVYDAFDISLDCKAYSRFDDMNEALKRGDVEIIFPICGDYWVGEQLDLFLSNNVASINSELLYRGELNEETTEKIAVSDMSPFQRYIATMRYPDAELVPCHTTADCVNAVLSGAAGSTIGLRRYFEINGIDQRAIRALSETEIPQNAEISFGVRGGDTVAVSICDKWIQTIGSDNLTKSMVFYSSIVRDYTFQDFVADNPVTFLTITITIVFLVLSFATIYVFHSKKKNDLLLTATKSAEKARYEAAKQRLETEAAKESEERYKLALSKSGKEFFFFNIKEKTMMLSPEMAEKFHLPTVVKSSFEDYIALGLLEKSSERDLLDFYEHMLQGERQGETIVACHSPVPGQSLWFRMSFTSVADKNGAPTLAIVSCENINAQREADLAAKWKQTNMSALHVEKYTVITADLDRDCVIGQSGTLPCEKLTPGTRFGSISELIAKDVHPDDLKMFLQCLDRERLIEMFRNGRAETSVEYRSTHYGSAYRWTELSVQMIRDAYSDGILAQVLIMDIHERKSGQIELNRNMAELKKELENSRIRIMINQMQPHFLYNALSAIQTIVKVNPDYAASLIYDFTIHLRASIKALGSDDPISFSDELKNIEAYLNIEKMRTGGLLKVQYDITCRDFNVIPLAIQPLAENAARHGVYPKADEGGTVTIRSYERPDAYVVEVQDDGVGFDVAKVMNSNSDSIGLKNLVFRMKSLMDADVSVKSRINEGTVVSVVIPKKPKGK